MRFLGAVAVCAFLISACVAEDAQLRARAFELVERAQEVSAPKQSTSGGQTGRFLSAKYLRAVILQGT
jgi:hypothetical protein